MNSRQEDDLPAWWPDWRGQTAIVVASGPSAKDVPLQDARGRTRVLAINESWQLSPWADGLYASDGSWWESNRGVPEFRGLKFSTSPRAARMFPEIRLIHLVSLAKILLNKPGTIGCGSRYGNGHSGFHAINLAAQFGARRIVLVGFDMRIDLGSHWHGDHQGIENPNAKAVDGWRAELDGCASQFEGLGIQVINVSPVSMLKAYPKSDLMEAIAG